MLCPQFPQLSAPHLAASWDSREVRDESLDKALIWGRLHGWVVLGDRKEGVCWVQGLGSFGLNAMGIPTLSVPPLIPGSLLCPGAGAGDDCMPGRSVPREPAKPRGMWGLWEGPWEDKCSPCLVQPHPAPRAQRKMKAAALSLVMLLAALCCTVEAQVKHPWGMWAGAGGDWPWGSPMPRSLSLSFLLLSPQPLVQVPDSEVVVVSAWAATLIAPKGGPARSSAGTGGVCPCLPEATPQLGTSKFLPFVL